MQKDHLKGTKKHIPGSADLKPLHQRWYDNSKLTSLSFFCVNYYFTTGNFYNIITQAQTEACAFSRRFCCKKPVINFVNDFMGNAVAIVLDADLYLIV